MIALGQQQLSKSQSRIYSNYGGAMFNSNWMYLISLKATWFGRLKLKQIVKEDAQKIKTHLRTVCDKSLCIPNLCGLQIQATQMCIECMQFLQILHTKRFFTHCVDIGADVGNSTAGLNSQICEKREGLINLWGKELELYHVLCKNCLKCFGPKLCKT